MNLDEKEIDELKTEGILLRKKLETLKEESIEKDKEILELKKLVKELQLREHQKFENARSIEREYLFKLLEVKEKIEKLKSTRSTLLVVVYLLLLALMYVIFPPYE